MPNKQEAVAHCAHGPFDGHPADFDLVFGGPAEGRAGVSSQADGKVASKAALS